MRSFHVLFRTFSVLMLTVLSLMTVPVLAQDDAQCFDQTNQCISGAIREFWTQNGDLPVFGYPVTAQQAETIEGTALQVQWFERNRLEIHPEGVLLGRLGVEVLEQQGRPIQTNLTENDIAPEFRAYWESQGLDLGDEGVSFRESLALFGYPISQALPEVNAADGERYLTQWFERARFEYHPDTDQMVLLGLLGNELLAADDNPAPPPPDTQETPEPEPDPSPSVISGPCSTNAPDITEGAHVWVTDTHPTLGSEVLACAILVRGNQMEADVFYNFHIQYSLDNFQLLAGRTDNAGLGMTSFVVDPSVGPGATVEIEIIFAIDNTNVRATTTLITQ